MNISISRIVTMQKCQQFVSTVDKNPELKASISESLYAICGEMDRVFFSDKGTDSIWTNYVKIPVCTIFAKLKSSLSNASQVCGEMTKLASVLQRIQSQKPQLYDYLLGLIGEFKSLKLIMNLVQAVHAEAAEDDEWDEIDSSDVHALAGKLFLRRKKSKKAPSKILTKYKSALARRFPSYYK